MLVLPIKIKVVKKLNIPYTWKIITTTENHYIKSYEPIKHLSIKDFQEVNHISNNNSIILEREKDFIYCPLLEDIYKSASNLQRNKILFTVKVKYTSTRKREVNIRQAIVSFEYKKQKFKTKNNVILKIDN